MMTSDEREPMTVAQARTYRTIVESIAGRGYPPTVREISDAAGSSTVNGTVRLLEILERKGYIRRTPGKARAITVLSPAGEPIAAPQ